MTMAMATEGRFTFRTRKNSTTISTFLRVQVRYTVVQISEEESDAKVLSAKFADVEIIARRILDLKFGVKEDR
ncbi:hypothetical protein K3495_g2848 [Podosphaera aphanis]|nr:hypothetical protein K3495_g2848 [Podosphaera aphanis]